MATAVASARTDRAVASRLELPPRDDDPSLGRAVLVELEVVEEKFCRVLVVEEVKA